MTKQEQAMRLYQAIERLSLQAGEDVDEAVEWLCGESGGMFKLYQQYFSPKQPREWQGLTNEELELLNDCGDTDSYKFARAIEAKLKEKNS